MQVKPGQRSSDIRGEENTGESRRSLLKLPTEDKSQNGDILKFEKKVLKYMPSATDTNQVAQLFVYVGQDGGPRVCREFFYYQQIHKRKSSSHR